jgi:hypothetical protein
VAYDKGENKDMEKRMVDLGHLCMSGDLSLLREKCLAAVREIATSVFPSQIEAKRLDGKAFDRILLPMQSQIRSRGMNVVWVEKMRLLATSAVDEQWKRGQANLFGRLKHISQRGDRPCDDGHLRLVSLPEEWSRALTDVDVAALQKRADGLDFRGAMAFFAELRLSDAGLTEAQAGALRAMLAAVEDRFSCPEWRDDATIQLHLDGRCFRGGASALKTGLGKLSDGLLGSRSAKVPMKLTGPVAYGAGIEMAFCLPEAIAQAYADRKDQKFGSLVVELGPEKAQLKGVIVRPRLETSVVGHRILLGEDFGFAKTSSIVVVKSPEPVSREIVDFVETKPGKEKTKEYLEGHVSGDEIEVLEQWQISGKNFLDLIKEHALSVDGLRGEIDRCYNRLDRIREEINLIAGRDPKAFVPPELDAVSASNTEQARYARMHGRFFRLLNGIGKIKARRRDVYRKVAAVKKSWLGFVSNMKIKLAEKHGAAVASEDLTILTVPKDDLDYKGRTFNKMINNGAKGQYIRRSEDKLKWRGIAHIKVPSYFSSSTDWRTATVDKGQRTGSKFTALDGTTWDADLHAGEMLARWLFLRPKTEQELPGL